jgi:hypothetical protein
LVLVEHRSGLLGEGEHRLGMMGGVGLSALL